LLGTKCTEYLSVDHRKFLNPELLSSDYYQQLRRLSIGLCYSEDDWDLDSLRPLRSLPQLQDLTITGLMPADKLSLRWLAMLPTDLAKIRVAVKLACPSEHLLELMRRDRLRIEHLELDCTFPKSYYCQYRVVRFLGLIAKRTTVNIPLVCNRTHIEKLFCLREALVLQETEEYHRRPPFENFVTLMTKEILTIKEEPTNETL